MTVKPRHRSLFIQARGVLKRQLFGHLRPRRRMRRSHKAATDGQARGLIVDAVSIRERPAEIEDRAIPGHWDTIACCGSIFPRERISHSSRKAR
jgi:IS30 family transposase